MAAIAQPRSYHLEDNLTARHQQIFLTGTQALVRMLLSQKSRDRARGVHSAGFVSGYRGSPLGGVDQAMWRAQEQLQAHDIRFVPAINEDLAATMVLGTQQAGLHDQKKVDGVFAMWYGKGPGVDRAGDALHHGNAAGASRLGGVLLIVGDDHTAASSSIPHASDATLAALSIPVIHPASVEDYEYFGLWGWALSRFSGAWVAFKAITETVESGRAFTPSDIPLFDMPAEATMKHRREYSAREFLTPAIEERMQQRLEAVRLFNRHHPLDRILDAADHARVGIISVGKAALDVSEALRHLRAAGSSMPAVRHMRIGLVWPLDVDAIGRFAMGLDHLLVVEEKSPVVEDQLKSFFFNHSVRPSVHGKLDALHQVLIPASGQVTPLGVAHAISRWMKQTINVDVPAPEVPSIPVPRDIALRRPYFCSGCPHSTSTRVPEGSRALGGVGCHYMATWMDRNTEGLTQMGGEGVDWIGLAPYVKEGHVFQNMGEGTYFHSGLLAIRQAVAAKANITYKILFNDAVAMTGGQPVDGPISVEGLCRQLLGEGVQHIEVTTDEPERYRNNPLPVGITVHHRKELDAIQRRLREMPGVTVLIHDQTCAAEKRRRRKKKQLAQPDRRLFINTAVCEGCGDCSVQSNCLSIVPVDTPDGRKRAIEQSSCNSDFSCAEGFCPSFVSVIGAQIRRSGQRASQSDPAQLEAFLEALPHPTLSTHKDNNILVVGIGGTGVVTIGALISMAANLENRAAAVLDITGLAQKGGAVISHVRVGRSKQLDGPVRIDVAAADTAILCDAVAGMKPDAWHALAPMKTLAIVNRHIAPPSEFTRDPDATHDPAAVLDLYERAVGKEHVLSLDAHDLALRHLGDTMFANMILLGHAWQTGAIPITLDALLKAIELNGVAVDANVRAFRIGRLSAWRPEVLEARRASTQDMHIVSEESIEELMERHGRALTAYQDARYAQRYTSLIKRLLETEHRVMPRRAPELTLAAARSLYRFMAIKDEYEVARLYTDGEFRKKLKEQFEGDFTLRFHLAPPLLARKNPHTGHPEKMTFGPLMETWMKLLGRARVFRGKWFDVFSLQAERKEERRLLIEFESLLNQIADTLDEATYERALKLVKLPDIVRGFGHVKAANIARYELELRRLGVPFTTRPVQITRLVRAHS